MNIPILKISFSEEDKAFVERSLREVLESGVLTMGRYTSEFEEMFGAHVGAKYCLATSSGTTALETILRSLDIRDRSVIVPTNTFFATAHAVMHSRNKVVFADSNPNTLCLDPKDLQRRIADDTAAVILVHIGGIITPDVYDIQRICKEHGLFLIEDCAHAHGCIIDGRQAGTLGVAGAFSFFPTKVLVTGEGGVVTTNDEALYRRACVIRNHGKDPDRGNRISEIGHNFRMSEITAALGIQQVQKAAPIIAERRRVAGRYDELLPGLRTITGVSVPANVHSSYYKYIAYLREGSERAGVKRRLKEGYGVSLTGEVYADLCHAEPIWERYSYCGAKRLNGKCLCPRWPGCGCDLVQDDFPGATHISRWHICLPLYPALTDAEVSWVVEALDDVLNKTNE